MIVITSSIESLAAIEREARRAAEQGLSMHDACRWPADSIAAYAFQQAWTLHAQAVAPSTPSLITQS